nr:MAG TPA: hypothetical protein [Caudoviricetes sp.]
MNSDFEGSLRRPFFVSGLAPDVGRACGVSLNDILRGYFGRLVA